MIGRKILNINKVNSTNSYVLELISTNQKLENETVYISDNQIAGKGQGENLWESEPGKNLTFSIYLEPRFLNPADQFYLNISISLGIQKYVSSLVKEKVWIKWPNDIYILNKKVAGILINHTISGQQLINSVVGIGLNMNQKLFISDAPNPGSLIHFTGKECNLDIALSDLLSSINDFYLMLKKSNIEKLTFQYFEVLLGYQQWREYNYQNQVIKAKITGISNFGTLLLIDDHKNRLECGFKEIEFII
jgi:BirA family biotin operon repressor/biotin-[acetyl-CoA-carboxylase] ligase